jgi:hypothetical protein
MVIKQVKVLCMALVVIDISQISFSSNLYEYFNVGFYAADQDFG